MMSKIKPPVKWAGGKTKLLPQIINKIELLKTKKTFYDPFGGGGAVSIGMSKFFNKIIYNDINKDLTTVFEVIRDNPDELIYLLKDYSAKHSEDFYYKIRKVDREEDYIDLDNLHKSARMIYLNKTCYNGLYRINMGGYFNVPMGKNNHKLYNKENILNLSRLINEKIQIMNKDYKKAIKKAVLGDVVYFDPPYDKINKNSFQQYTSLGFGRKQQLELKKLIDKLTSKGVYVIFSNAATDFIIENFKEYINEDSIVYVKRLLGSKVSSRIEAREVLVDNFHLVNRRI